MLPVSSESEELILVDSNDQVLGYDTKARVHDGDGVLHRAFSIFLFNLQGELLLQQRGAGPVDEEHAGGDGRTRHEIDADVTSRQRFRLVDGGAELQVLAGATPIDKAPRPGSR